MFGSSTFRDFTLFVVNNVVAPLALTFSFLSSLAAAADLAHPNIVLVLTDNHGAWTLGCYGNKDIRTPHLDQMAEDGTLFSQAYAVNPVCSPTRASILTGLMPSQHGVMTPTDGPFMMGPRAYNLLDEFDSLPEILKANGYACGLSGKWHLGKNLEPQEGLDDMWVTMPVGSTSTFYGANIIENGEVRVEPQYMTDLWTDRAVEFIAEQTAGDNKESPYFLYLAYNGPYGLSPLLLEPPRNRHAEFYRDHPLPSFPRVATRPWQFPNRDYVNNLDAFRRYAAEVSGVDDGVGRVLQAIRDSGQENDTLVIFTGDQGLGCGHNNLWGMGDHTRPLHLFDVTLRVPLIVKMPGTVAKGQRVDELVSQVDLLPTVLELAGLGDKKPTDHPLPGRDLSGVLASNEKADPERPIFADYENSRSIRTANWKLIERINVDQHFDELFALDELYNLEKDPGETINLYNDASHAEIREQLKMQLNAFFATHRLPKHDMWNGGESQTHNIVMGEHARDRYRSMTKERGYPLNPFDPNFNPPSMIIPDGFAVETAAAAPLVNHPVAGCLDDQGRLFLCENVGENLNAEELEKKMQNKITVLTDTNRDGLFDKAATFADGLTFPQGCLWHDGALYVASPPNIWKMEDTNNDGIADQREIVASGFGYNGNAASLHTPRMSPTGRLFWCHGRKESEVRDRNGKVVHTGNSARIWTAFPDGSDLKTFCGGGMANPVEVDFWKTGEVIGNVNILMRQPSRSDCLVHWQQGGVYPIHSMETSLNEFTPTGDLLREIANYGHVAVAGLTRYRSGRISPPGEDWTDQFFMTLFNTQELVRLQIERQGASFKSVTHPFLTIHDPDVHLVGVLEDADGSILLIDTGGWFRQGCPASGVAKPDIAGAVYRIRKAGPYDRTTDWRGENIDWENAGPDHLGALLSDSRFTVRERAATAIAKMGDSSIPALANICASHPDPDTRIHAVFALSRNPSKKSLVPLRSALRDTSIEVRIAATHALGERRDGTAVVSLSKNLHHASESLQRETASALGHAGHPKALPPLVKALSNSQLDRIREHNLIRAILDIDDPEATGIAFTSALKYYGDNPDFLRRRLIVLSAIDPGALGAEEVLPHLLSEDEALRDLALATFDRNGKWHVESPRIIQSILQHSGVVQLPVARALLDKGLAKNDPKVRQLVDRFLSHEKVPFREVALSALANHTGIQPESSWLPPLRKMLLAGRIDALSAIAGFSPQPFSKEIAALAADDSKPGPLRMQALQLTHSEKKSFSDNAFSLVESILTDPGSSPGDRIQAVQFLGSGPGLNLVQREKAARLMAKAGPLEFPVFFEHVRPVRDNTELGAAFVDAYLTAPGASAIAPEERKRMLIALFEPDFWKQPVALLNEEIAAGRNLVRKIDRIVARVENGKGDANRGKEIALAATSTCIVCHRIGETGNHVGPDLSRIGQIRNPADLVESIIMPSASFAQDYEAVTITLINGSSIGGVIQSEKPDAIELALPSGQIQIVRRGDIKSLTQLPVSLMPPGLDQVIGDQGLIDLVTYLSGLK